MTLILNNPKQIKIYNTGLSTGWKQMLYALEYFMANDCSKGAEKFKRRLELWAQEQYSEIEAYKEGAGL